MRTQKELVRLRQRKISGDQRSLYLDIYIDGKRTYEYLHLYLLPETTRQNKDKNRETLQLAEAVKSQRLVEIQNGSFGFTHNNMLKTPFLDYFRDICQHKKEKSNGSVGNYSNWISALRHLELYCSEKTTFENITVDWILGFRDYLEDSSRIDRHKDRSKHYTLQPLSQNSKKLYFTRLTSALKQAYREHILQDDITLGISNFKQDEKERIFLTPDEVRKMASVECGSPVLKRAFIFSCMTGLRKSDIMDLRWEQVSTVNGFTRITFRQKKTNGLMYQDINPQAVEYMGDKKSSGKVFDGFIYNANTSILLQRWALNAGISKKITYHSSRHTFVLMLLDSGVDFYTVSKLVGHADIKTTLKYSHILDSKKREAILSLPTITNNNADK